MTPRISLFAAFAALTLAGCSASAAGGAESMQAELSLTIEDEVFFHNVSIAHDGENYYTVNGGNTDYGMVNVYDNGGDLVDSYDIPLDGRAILYSARDDAVYIKTYGGDLYEFDREFGSVEPVFRGDFNYEQSSPGIFSKTGLIVEHEEGTVYLIDPETGEDKGRLSGLKYGEWPTGEAVACTDNHILTWDHNGLVHVQDKGGDYIGSFELKKGSYGFSLSWANGMLWVSDDADASSDGGLGTWYGYKVKGLK